MLVSHSALRWPSNLSCIAFALFSSLISRCLSLSIDDKAKRLCLCVAWSSTLMSCNYTREFTSYFLLQHQRHLLLSVGI